MTLAEFKRRLAVGATFTCTENTFKPELKGQRRVVTKVQSTSFAWQIVGVTGAFLSDGVRATFWTDLPKAKDVMHPEHADSVTFKIRGGDHLLTLKFD